MPNWNGITEALGHQGVTRDADPRPARDGLDGVLVVGRAGRFVRARWLFACGKPSFPECFWDLGLRD